MVASADQRGAESAIGKEVADRDNGGSERHHPEGGRREQVREHEHADERDGLRAGCPDRQEERASRPTVAYGRRAFRRG